MTIRTPESTNAGIAGLVQRARDGNPEALGELYARFGATLFRLAYHLTGTRHDAEDVVQDVFVGLPEALGNYQERGTLEPWLKRVTTRVALMRHRAVEGRREVTLGTEHDTPLASDRPSHLELEAALAALPASLRSVVVLKEIEGYAHEEIAELLDISVGASRVRLLRAIRRLRKAFGDEP